MKQEKHHEVRWRGWINVSLSVYEIQQCWYTWVFTPQSLTLEYFNHYISNVSDNAANRDSGNTTNKESQQLTT